jgi:hypothetical protein
MTDMFEVVLRMGTHFNARPETFVLCLAHKDLQTQETGAVISVRPVEGGECQQCLIEARKSAGVLP